ncbi:MAG: aerotolerance regulator BatA [Candidatus Marinimicrobia bacterium]|jgi:Ca-activated chloride channel family protein|nr:aerotolerance regulator BatA [Candidatus Neomarinimicrobiota bacterium]MEC7622062.1 VWA domain-containing protein [Candidatus Neomarinimicrobiota bacterium]|tara:strand:+ start:99 stop:1070 length:972 start_codon:yes stop_codon:yes gene_type:complete
MIILGNPWYLLILAILPLIFIYKSFLSRSKDGSFRISSKSIISEKMIRKGVYKKRLLSFIQYLSMFLIILGLSRPRMIESLQEKNIEIIDIVLVIDISSSMLATDFQPNRLEVVKKTAKDFITQRKGDRLGILVFAGESFIQCPLTIDNEVLLSLMSEIKVAQQSYDGTAIGMAIANATNRLRNSDAKSKVMILLSDGSNNAGELDPNTAADLAKQFGIKIYTIGAGTNQDVSFIPGRGYIRNEIDEETLKAIAKQTGGQYFRATNTEGLKEIYSTINALERTEVEIKVFTQYRELYGWLFIPALALGLGGNLLGRLYFRRWF